MAWYIDSALNDGYPTNTDFPGEIISGWTSNDNIKLPASAWRITAGVNDGYPYTWWQIAADSGWINNPSIPIGGIPSGGGGGGGEEDTGDLTSQRNNRAGFSGISLYGCTKGAIKNLINYFNVTYQPTDEELKKDFKGANPFDYIFSVIRYPFSIQNFFTGSTTNIIVGPIDTSINSLDLSAGSIINIGFGVLSIPAYYGDFRDFKPYTSIILQLPYVQQIELDPAEYIGHQLGAEYTIDLVTGSVAAYIYRDNLLMQIANGTIGVTVPLAMQAAGSYQNFIAQSKYSIAQQGIGIAQQAISGIGSAVDATQGDSVSGKDIAAAANSALGIASSIVSISQIKYKMDHTQPQLGTISAASPLCGFYADSRARLVILRPVMLSGYDESKYAHTVGHACTINNKLGDNSGFTVCSAVNLDGVPATALEKQMISAALQSGVIV